MADLREQARAIINVCKTALAGKAKDQSVDNQTIAIAQAIVAQAKSLSPDDKVLAVVGLEPPVLLWTAVQSAMEIVVATSPAPQVLQLERVLEARKRARPAE